VPNLSHFDNAAVAVAACRFADLIAANPKAEAVRRIEVTLTGRGPIERLFALEAALLDCWPDSALRPACDLVSSTGELGPSAALTLRAFGQDGAEILRRTFDLESLKRAPAQAHV
jgi:hypothetical protein